jgi:hypothetical protein
MRAFTILLGVLGMTSAATSQPAEMTIAADGNAQAVIVVAADATAPEKHAAEELAKFLGEITGAKFDVVGPEKAGSSPRIAVGPGAAQAVAPGVELKDLGPDGIVIRTAGANLVLSGQKGAPRGTLYAVYTFLEDTVGCRWWTSTVSRIPKKPALKVPAQQVRYVPVLEYREPFHIDAFDGDWAVRNKSNGHATRLDEPRGGKISYKGFVHTFYSLVPPSLFEKHPEWFSLIKGQRTTKQAQLCLTNKELKAYVVEQVLAWLKESPQAKIVSISQNDWHGNCACDNCAAVEKDEGSPAGLLLRFVNGVAEAIERDHPDVALDTLAYQYTRKPPKITKPRPNVIVRLCSIECSFCRPLTDEQNAAFRADIEGWSKIGGRLYIWDYVTDFAHYVQPFPNLRVLGPNVRFFVKHGVKGIFEQGNYQSPGGELAELRAWVLAKLLWNSELDDKALIDEFIDGYYEQAAPAIKEYIRLVHDSAEKTGTYLGIGVPPTSPYLSLDVLTKAETLFQQAEKAVADKPDLLKRVELAHLPVRYVMIFRWPELTKAAEAAKVAWPLSGTRLDAITDFERVCKDHRVSLLAEWSGKKVGWLREQFGKEAPKTAPTPKAP